MNLPYKLIDADNHYYETHDCFTRHIESKYRDRAVVAKVLDDGIGRVYVGDRRLPHQPNWPIDYAGKPGSLMEYFMGEVKRTEMIGEAIDARQHPEYIDRGARVRLLDEQNVETAVMLPTIGVSVEHDIRDDIEALYANFRAFNRWIDEEWGWARDDRILSVAALSLVDPQQAAAEVHRVVAEGCRFVYLAPGPAYGRSPADPVYDPFWSVLNDTGVPVIFHIGDTTGRYAELWSAQWGEKPAPPLHRMSAFQTYACSGEHAISDTLAALILHNLFGRFPRLRVMTIELGCAWVGPLLKALDKAHRNSFGRPSAYGQLDRLPSEIFKEHVWVTPFFEDDFITLVDQVGPERVLFGSDFPHPEGVAEPIQLTKRLDGLSEEAIRLIMRENTAQLLVPPR